MQMVANLNRAFSFAKEKNYLKTTYKKSDYLCNKKQRIW